MAKEPCDPSARRCDDICKHRCGGDAIKPRGDWRSRIVLNALDFFRAQSGEALAGVVYGTAFSGNGDDHRQLIRARAVRSASGRLATDSLAEKRLAASFD